MKVQIDFSDIDEEDSLRRKKLAFMLRKKDEELTNEHKWNKSNVCPHCHVVLTAFGYCSFGCGYKK